jgi:hypothetical protein
MKSSAAILVMFLLVAPFVSADPNDRDDYYQCYDSNIETFGGSLGGNEYGSVRGEQGPVYEWNGEQWVRTRGEGDYWADEITVTGTETEVRYTTPHVYDKVVLYETVDLGEQKAVIHEAGYNGTIQTTGGQGVVFFMCYSQNTVQAWYRGEFLNDFPEPAEVPEFGLATMATVAVLGAGLIYGQRSKK